MPSARAHKSLEWRSLYLPEVRSGFSQIPSSAQIVGYAAKFNSPTSIRGVTEIIRRGAFQKSISRGDDVRALIDHNPTLVIGRSVAGTLQMSEDELGLRVEIRPPNTGPANDLIENLKAGNVSQMSFGFLVPVGGSRWRRSEKGVDIRELVEVDLYDVSVVTFPAYKATTASVRT